MPVRRLLEVLDSDDIAEYVAAFQLNRWGEQRAELRSAIVAHATATAAGATVQVQDFMPFDRTHEVGQSDEDIAATLRRIQRVWPKKKTKKNGEA